MMLDFGMNFIAPKPTIQMKLKYRMVGKTRGKFSVFNQL